MFFPLITVSRASDPFKSTHCKADLGDVTFMNQCCFKHPNPLRSPQAAKSCPAGRTCINGQRRAFLLSRTLGIFLSLLSLVGCELTQEQKSDSKPAIVEKKTTETQKSIKSESDSSGSSAILNDMGLSLVHIRAGLFQMGSSEPEKFGDFSRCEGPRHSVRITRDFQISLHEVTVGQFRTFVDATGYSSDAEKSGLGCNGLDVSTGGVIRRPECVWSSPGFEQSERHPVVCLSWADAVAFCEWLSKKSGQVCRLPTEAEWEYCCRAGTDTLFENGNETESLRVVANCGDQSLRIACSSLTATADWDDGFAFTAPVGSFKANRFGLHDMHGNVGEWCLDWFEADYYSRSPETDPRGPETAQQWHVIRGGSWYNNPASCRSSGRHDGIPTEASTTNGFRIVIEIAGKS